MVGIVGRQQEQLPHKDKGTKMEAVYRDFMCQWAVQEDRLKYLGHPQPLSHTIISVSRDPFLAARITTYTKKTHVFYPLTKGLG